MGRILVETAIHLSMRPGRHGEDFPRCRAQLQGRGDAIFAAANLEGAAKKKAKCAEKPSPNLQPKSGKKAADSALLDDPGPPSVGDGEG